MAELIAIPADIAAALIGLNRFLKCLINKVYGNRLLFICFHNSQLCNHSTLRKWTIEMIFKKIYILCVNRCDTFSLMVLVVSPVIFSSLALV